MMNEEDILLFHDGDLVRVIEKNFPTKGMTRIESSQDDQSRFVSTDSIDGMFENLGRSPNVRALYFATRSIHLRLNKLGKV